MNKLKRHQKMYFTQIAAVAAVFLIVIIGGRILTGNRFEMSIPYGYDDAAKQSEDIQIIWEDGREIPVIDVSIRSENETLIVLCPDKPGDYIMHVMHDGGRELFYDELHVSRMLTTYSMQTRNFTGDNAVIAGITLLFLGLAIISIRRFVKLDGSQLCSYDAIWLCGVGIFCAVTGLNFLNIFLRRLIHAEMIWMRYIYETFSLSGWIFSLILIPVMLAFSILMIVSNIELLRHERVRVQNVLGLGIGFALIICEIVGFRLLFWDFSGSEMQVRIIYTLSSVYYTMFTYFECILIGSVVCGLRAARHIPAPVQDYILILGCGFRKDGTLPPLLRGRVDKAIEFWKKQQEQGGKEAILLPTGGQGTGEPMPEAEAMGRYLRECGIPERAILQEEKSRNTYQNMEFSKKLIEEREGNANDKNIIFVTTNYHVFRSGVWAGLADLRAEGLGSNTKWWFWPNAFIRECVGLLANRIVPEVIILVILIILFASVATLIV